MLQIKFVQGVDMPDLERSTNEALSKIKSENVEVNCDMDRFLAIIKYDLYEVYKDHICCECMYWDDSGSHQSITGFCTLTGKRMRFSCHACPQFKDVRD